MHEVYKFFCFGVRRIVSGVKSDCAVTELGEIFFSSVLVLVFWKPNSIVV